MLLLRDGLLVADGLPTAGAADPDAGVAIGTAEIFTELMAFDVGAGGDDRGVAVDANDHFSNVDGFIAKLAAFAGGENVLLGGDLTERGDADVVIGQSSLAKIDVTMQAGVFGLPFQIDDLADDILIAGIERRTGMNRDVLRGDK